MCPDAARLRLAWYAASEQFTGELGVDFNMAMVEASRGMEYQRLLNRYMAHRLNCPTCASEMGREIPQRLERVG